MTTDGSHRAVPSDTNSGRLFEAYFEPTMGWVLLVRAFNGVVLAYRAYLSEALLKKGHKKLLRKLATAKDGDVERVLIAWSSTPVQLRRWWKE